MNNIFQVYVNDCWNDKTPFFTVVTPVFNRQDVLPRAIASIEKQKCRDFEYIIVNDGSEENLDDIVFPFMNNAGIPIMYIKKSNGGVHTARNAGIKHARGHLITWLDSDDEFLPETLLVLKDAWEHRIPAEKKEEYYQISSRCREANGTEGVVFPDSINSLEIKESYRIYHKNKSENLVADRTDIMKANLWPEPEGITFVGEDVVWLELERKYRTWFLNDILRIYHTEGTDHIFNSARKKNIQYVKNCLWSLAFHLNNWKKERGVKVFFDSLIKYCIFRKIYREKREDFELKKTSLIILSIVLFLPTLIASYIYKEKKMV